MKTLVETLIRGRDSAKRLQNLLCQKGNDDGSVSVNDLVMEISKSFGEGLSILTSYGFGEICSPHVGLTCSSDQQYEVITGNKSKKILTTLAKDRYKRRKNVDSSDKRSDTIEDCFAWRKYGQKDIVGSKFPRCYYRCTYKDEQRCMAVKQVQQLEGKSYKFSIKYIGCHTCTTPQQTVSHPTAAAAGHRVLLDFEGFKKNGYLASNPLTTKNTSINPSRKQKIQSNKNKSGSDARPAPTMVPNNIWLDELSPFYEASSSDYGEYSSPSYLLNDHFGNHEMLVDDITIEPLWV